MVSSNNRLASLKCFRRRILCLFSYTNATALRDSGVLSAVVAAVNPQLQQRLDSAVVERAIAYGYSTEAVQDGDLPGIVRQAQRSGQPETYAKNVVKR